MGDSKLQDAQQTRKELWLSANERFRMRSGLARNCGFAGMGDLECAVDYHVLSSFTDFE